MPADRQGAYPEPFSSRIGTDIERAHIQSILEASISELEQLNRELSELEQLNREFTANLDRQQILQNHIDTCRALLSPIQRLPPDILQEIFVHCLPTDHNAIMSSKEAPLVLGLVCHTWRSTSFTTPRLWASIHITVPNLTMYDTNLVNESSLTSSRRKDEVTSWLARSGQCPLSISVAQGHRGRRPGRHGYNSGFDVAADIMSILVLHANRWKHIEFNLSRNVLLKFFTLLSERDVPLLESLSVNCFENLQIRAELSAIFAARRLRTLCLSNMSGDIFAFNVGWPSLTELYLENFGVSSDYATGIPRTSPEHVLELLSRCHNLVRCSIDMFGVTSGHVIGPPLTLSTVSMPRLTQLWVKQTSWSLRPFFNRLDTPLLTTFKFTITTTNWQFEEQVSASSFLLRLPMLETLYISNLGNLGNLSYMYLEQCLQSASLITRLILNDSRGTRVPYRRTGVAMSHTVNEDLLMNGLRATTQQGSPISYLCPRLQIFEARGISFSDDSLLLFIKSRFDAGLPLKRVEIFFNRLPTVDLESQLETQVAAGLELVLHYPSEVSVSVRYGLQWKERDWL